MKTLFEAIYARWLSEGKLGLTQLYNTEASANAIFPYGVFSLPNDVPGVGEFDEDWEDCLVQFNLFIKETLSTEICAAFEALKAAFDHYDLSVSGYETISLVREPANLTRPEKIWQYNVAYSILIQKE